MLCLAPSNPNFAGALDKMMRADLEAWSSFWFWILIASTIMVVIGIICEAPEIWQSVGLGRKTVEHAREFWYVRVKRTDLNGWERLCPELITKTRRNRKWVATIGLIGWAFVALGVAGEGVSEYFVNDAETNIRAFDESLLAGAQGKAAFAIERASENEREAAQLRTDAEGFKLQIAQANERAADAERETTRLRQKLADRILSPEQLERIKAKIESFHGTPYELAVNDVPEAIRLVESIDNVLRSAGWLCKPSENKALRFTFTLSNGDKAEISHASGVEIALTKSLLGKYNLAAGALQKALGAEGIEATGRILPEDDPSPNAIHITIGSKP